MKAPFDFQRCVNGDKMVTRDGAPAYFLHLCLKFTRPLLVQIEGHDVVSMCHIDGMVYNGLTSDLDLFMDVPHPHQAMMDKHSEHPDWPIEYMSSGDTQWKPVRTCPTWGIALVYRFEPVIRLLWQNIYKNILTGEFFNSDVFLSEEKAISQKEDALDYKYIGTFPITIEEPRL